MKFSTKIYNIYVYFCGLMFELVVFGMIKSNTKKNLPNLLVCIHIKPIF